MSSSDSTMTPRQREAHDVWSRHTSFLQNSGHSAWVENLVRWDKQWRMLLGRNEKPWPHASEFNPPLTWSKVEDVHAVICSFFQDLEFFGIAPASLGVDPKLAEGAAEDWRDYMRWSLMNQSNAIPHIDAYVHDGCRWGCGFSKVGWERDVRRIMSEHFVPDDVSLVVQATYSETSKRSQVSGTDIIVASLAEKLKSGPGKATDRGRKVTFLDDDGEEKDGFVNITYEHPFRPLGVPVVTIERERVMKDAPSLDVIRPSHMYVPASVKDLQTAKRFWQLERMTYDNIAKLRRSTVFNALTPADLKRIKLHLSNKQGGTPTESDRMEEERDRDEMFDLTHSLADECEIIWEYAYEDVDGDGYAESIVRAIADIGSPILLCRHRLEYLFPHCRRPFADWHFTPVGHRYYGMGIPEILEGCQREENAFYQARSDTVELISKPSGMYHPLSGLAPDSLQIMPGTLIRTRDPKNAFQPFQFPTDPGHLWREQSGVELQAERAIGSTDMGLGRGPTRPNAPRTLGGTALVVRQQQVRTDVALRRVMYGCGGQGGGIREILMQYMALSAAFMPSELTIRTGTGELKTIDRGSLQGRYDFVVNLGPDVNNPQLRMQNAQVRYQNMLGNPLVQRDPRALYLLTVDFLRATGMKDAEKVLTPPTGDDRAPMDQEDENVVMARGVYVEPLLSDNHQEHLTAIMQTVQNEQALAQMFSADKLPLLEQHAQRHQQMMMQGAQGGMMLPNAQGAQQQGGSANLGGEQVAGPPEMAEMEG